LTGEPLPGFPNWTKDRERVRIRQKGNRNGSGMEDGSGAGGAAQSGLRIGRLRAIEESRKLVLNTYFRTGLNGKVSLSPGTWM
jgi:hypothetical protein